MKKKFYMKKKGSAKFFRNVSMLLIFLIFFSFIFFSFVETKITGEVTENKNKEHIDEEKSSLGRAFLFSSIFILLVIFVVGIVILLKVK